MCFTPKEFDFKLLEQSMVNKVCYLVFFMNAEGFRSSDEKRVRVGGFHFQSFDSWVIQITHVTHCSSLIAAISSCFIVGRFEFMRCSAGRSHQCWATSIW